MKIKKKLSTKKEENVFSILQNKTKRFAYEDFRVMVNNKENLMRK